MNLKSPSKRVTALAVFTGLIVAGIVVIPKLVASPEHAKCEWRPAFEVGLSNLLPREPPKPVPENPFFDMDGNEIGIADYRGKTIIMNFWATWCPPCVAEMASLDRLRGLLAGTNMEVLTINEDRNGEEAASAFFEEKGLTNLRILIDHNMKLSRATNISGMPTTLLINSKGEEVAAILGEAEWDNPDIVAYLKQCLGEDKDTGVAQGRT